MKKANQAAAISSLQTMDTNAKALAKKLVDSIVKKRTDAATQVHPPVAPLMDPIDYSAGKIDDQAYQYQQDLSTRKIQAGQSAGIRQAPYWRTSCRLLRPWGSPSQSPGIRRSRMFRPKWKMDFPSRCKWLNWTIPIPSLWAVTGRRQTPIST